MECMNQTQNQNNERIEIEIRKGTHSWLVLLRADTDTTVLGYVENLAVTVALCIEKVALFLDVTCHLYLWTFLLNMRPFSCQWDGDMLFINKKIDILCNLEKDKHKILGDDEW